MTGDLVGNQRGDASDDQGELSLSDTPLEPASAHVWIRLAPVKPTVAYETYWQFAAERQEIFFRRLIGEPPPWTRDAILAHYKFTNAYRASDRVSQYLIRRVIYDDNHAPSDLLFRILLFKLFNRIETWELIERAIGMVCLAEYRFDVVDGVLSGALARGERIYSAAYIMPAGTIDGIKDARKHRFHLRLLERMMSDHLADRLGHMASMQDGFELLRTYPSIGSFLAYQYMTDINYSPLTNFSEQEFVMPGPGALDGIRKCFASLGGLTEPDVIRYVGDHQEREFESMGLNFRTLWGRRLQLIDCQNLFCEVSKYARVRHPEVRGVSDRTRIKQHFVPTSKTQSVWYPPKWHINERVPGHLLKAPTD